MAEAEIVELMYEALGYADRNFEFWISASFAVILAFHFSGDRISLLMYRLITFLYCSAAVLFISRWAVAGMQYAGFRGQLMEVGSSVQMTSNPMEALITLAYLLVYIIGTMGTVYFGHRSMRNARRVGPAS